MSSAQPSGEILFIVHRIPFPPDRGDKIRSFHQLHFLSTLAPVHVACFADDARDMSFAADMRRLTASQCVVLRDTPRVVGAVKGLLKRQPISVALFDDHRLREYIDKTLATRPIRAILVFSGQMGDYVPDIPSDMRFVMDFVDVDSAKFAAYGASHHGPMAWVNRREARLLEAHEERIARIADVSLLVSDAEAALFRQTTGLDAHRIRAVGNGVDTDYFNPGADIPVLDATQRGPGPLILFTGQMDYRPNIEAVTSFARTALPAIRRVHHEARFAIVGRAPTNAVTELAREPGVVVTGSVEDVRPWLAAADVVVAPLRIARGVQNKVLEAMAMARPVVASPQAAEGIDAVAGIDFIVAPDSTHEAQACIDLLKTPTRAASIGASARARCIARYGWDAALEPLAAMLGFDRTAR